MSIDHASRGHAEFSPSQLKYLRQCPAYEGREGTSDAAAKGTRIHEALEMQDPSALHDEEETMIYNKIVEEQEHLLDAFGADRAVIQREIQIEMQLDCEAPQWGTLDLFVMKNKEGLALDYKTGWGEIDPPRSNEQAKCYSLGLFQKFPELDRITFVFICPMTGENLTGQFSRETDLSTLREELSEIVRKAEQVRPKWTSPGQPELEDCSPTPHCRFCAHEDICPALGAIAVQAAVKYAAEHEGKYDKKISVLSLGDGPISSSNINDYATLEKLFVVATIVKEWAEGIRHKAITLAINEGDEIYERLKLRNMGAVTKITDGIGLIELGEEYGLTREEMIDWERAVSLSNLKSLLEKKAPRGKKRTASKSLETAAILHGVVEKGEPRYTLQVK